MNHENDTTRIVEGWLAEPVPPLDDRVITRAIDRLPGTPQRRRWWPFRRFPLGLGATRSTRSAGTRTDGRSQLMFTPIRATALGLAMALGTTVVLLGGPLAQDDGAALPGAATPSASPAPDDGVYFTGRMAFTNNGIGYPMGTTETDAEGITRGRDAGPFEVFWRTDEPRFSGTGTLTSSYDDYTAATGATVRVGWGSQTVEAGAGSWHSVGPVAGVHFDPTGPSAPEDSAIPVWFDGDGAYEGLSALLIYKIGWNEMQAPVWQFEGWIVPGDSHLEALLE